MHATITSGSEDELLQILSTDNLPERFVAWIDDNQLTDLLIEWRDAAVNAALADAGVTED